MGILTTLTSGSKIRFEDCDTDIWDYNGNALRQYESGSLTGETLLVINLNEDYITIGWETNVSSTLYEGDFIWVTS